MSIVLKLKADGRPILAGHDYYWTVVRELGRNGKRFTIREVDLRCGGNVDRRTVRDFMSRLERGGFVEKSKGEGSAFVYRLVKRPRMTPILRRDGTPGCQGRGQTQMWNAIRSLQTFAAPEIAVAATTDNCVIAHMTAKAYLLILARAGYLSTAVPGGPNKPTVWRLKPSMNTGPLAPKILRAKIVWDANREEVMGEVPATQVAS